MAAEPEYNLRYFSPFQQWLGPKLEADGSNFDVWYAAVSSTLVQRSKLGFVVDGMLERPDHEPLQQLYDKTASVVTFFLMNTLTTPVMEQVITNCRENPKSIMKYLTRTYNVDYFTRLQQWNARVAVLRQEEDEHVDDYCHRANKLSEEYNKKNLSMDAFDFDASQNMLLAQFLSGLRRVNYQFDVTIERIRAMNPPPSINLATKLLLQCNHLLTLGVN